MALLALVACQPIGGDGLWWQMSRGRAVWQGQLQPSASLLALESGREADWLGGLPLYAVYQVLGSSGGMLCRIALCAVAVLWLWKSWRGRRWASPLHLILVGLTAIALSSSLGLQPVFYDLLGVAVLPLWLLHRLAAPRPRESAEEPAADESTPAPAPPALSSRITLVAVGLGFVLWSNLATGIALGALLCLVGILEAWRRQTLSRTSAVMLVTAIVLGGSCNPRGVFAWIDSLQTLLPFLQNPAYVLAGTTWGSMLQNDWGWQEFYFLVLTAAWISDLFVNRTANNQAATNQAASVGDLLAFAIVQWFAWAALQNLPLAMLWMTANLVSRWRQPSVWPTATRLAVPTIVLLAAGWGSGLWGGFGWGIEQRQDYRLLRNGLQQTHPHGTAFADQTRSAAMLAWLLPDLPAPLADQPPMQLQDIPLRAVRRGRLERHHQLLSDLKRNRLMRYWRTDGSAGGYWLTFAERNTTLLCVSNTNFELIRGLEETAWKPLSLDSPVLPFAIAGDEAYVQQLIQILQNQETIEHRYWQYEPARSSGSEFDRDRLGLTMQPVTAEAIWEQAEVFRAMDLHYAALRVLVVGRERFPNDPALQDAFGQCQRELADQERIDAGAASWFRFLAAAAATSPEQRVPQDLPVPQAPPLQNLQTEGTSNAWQGPEPPPSRAVEIPAAAEPLRVLVDAYLEGGAPAMLEAGSRLAYDDAPPEVLYGCLCAAIESGQYELADQLLVRLRTHTLTSPLRELVPAREIEYRPERFN
ncbi:hypothetical protein UC8_01040 [Roseimaritima ulvae]|uniref:Uncharacterized protein n=2 Tax=Roseimaritima ulvae TaxID=980254 RepID=A0A5B9QVW2_9BACT|nr:hypothetical protein UC8_01040 [Roseimaritima ulvae]